MREAPGTDYDSFPAGAKNSSIFGAPAVWASNEPGVGGFAGELNPVWGGNKGGYPIEPHSLIRRISINGLVAETTLATPRVAIRINDPGNA